MKLTQADIGKKFRKGHWLATECFIPSFISSDAVEGHTYYTNGSELVEVQLGNGDEVRLVNGDFTPFEEGVSLEQAMKSHLPFRNVAEANGNVMIYDGTNDLVLRYESTRQPVTINTSLLEAKYVLVERPEDKKITLTRAEFILATSWVASSLGQSLPNDRHQRHEALKVVNTVFERLEEYLFNGSQP